MLRSYRFPKVSPQTLSKLFNLSYVVNYRVDHLVFTTAIIIILFYNLHINNFTDINVFHVAISYRKFAYFYSLFAQPEELRFNFDYKC